MSEAKEYSLGRISDREQHPGLQQTSDEPTGHSKEASAGASEDPFEHNQPPEGLPGYRNGIQPSDGPLPKNTTERQSPTEFSEVICPCNNREPRNEQVRFRQERTRESNELLGIYCKQCNTEWLRPEHLSTLSSRNEDDCMMVDGVIFFRNNPIEPVVSSRFQAPLPKTKITSIEQLNPGDHITWERVYVIWHHAIVIEVNVERGEIVTLEWNTNDNGKCWKTIEVIEKPQPYSDRLVCFCFNQMYRIDYPQEVTNENSTELVLARARSREGDTGYGPYTNCESFAIYCKTGHGRCHQTQWCKGKCLECACGIKGRGTVKLLIVAAQVVLSEGVEEVVEESEESDPTPEAHPHLIGELVSAAILITLEFILVCFIIYLAYRKKKSRQKTTEEFVVDVVRRVFEAFVYIGLVIGLSFVFEVELNLGLGGGILGGLIGGLLGTFFGHWIGGFVGKCVARCCCCCCQDDAPNAA